MGFLEWLGISPRDDPEIPKIEDNVRDSVCSAGRIPASGWMRKAPCRLPQYTLAFGSWLRRWLDFHCICTAQRAAVAPRSVPQIIHYTSCCIGSQIRR